MSKSNPQTKTNLFNFFANFYVENAELEGFGGATLEEQSGTSTFGFWLLQEHVTCDLGANGDFFEGHKRGGDVFLLVDVSPSSGPTLKAFRWTDPDGTPENGDECIGDGVDCSALHEGQPFAQGYNCDDPLQVNPATSAICAVVNTVPASSPWGTIPAHSLFEASIDFEELLPGETFHTYMAESRASNSLTAELKDFIVMGTGSYPRLEIEKIANAPGTFNFTATPDPDAVNPSLNFDLDTGGDRIFESPQSGAYTITEVGKPAATPPQAWVTTGISCAVEGDPNNPVLGDPGTGIVNFNLGPLDDVICTFTNFFEDPSISIDKTTNGADGLDIPVGTSITWRYVVTNTGNTALTNVAVTDDQGVSVTCPATVLAVGESMTCTANGTAVAGAYANIGTVNADAPNGTVQAQDGSSYTGTNPGLSINKYTNGQDADVAPGPSILVGTAVNWTYLVTNIGSADLTNVVVTDDQGVTVSCPATVLAVGANMTCTASGTAVAGQYANIGTVNAVTLVGLPVAASDPSHYVGLVPSISIVKSTNDEDANTAPGPIIKVGDPVHWDYLVTNTGQVTLNSISVTDSQLGAISCPQSSLAVGASMTCTTSSTAAPGQYENVGAVTAIPAGGTVPVQDNDPSHYFGTNAAISVNKTTNGVDADSPPGPVIQPGFPIVWEYLVTNTGGQPLTDIELEDDKLGIISCPKTGLAVGESMTCTANGQAVEGKYANLATVGGIPVPYGDPVTASDPSHYSGFSNIPTLGQWAIALLSMLLGLSAVLWLRKKT